MPDASYLFTVFSKYLLLQLKSEISHFDMVMHLSVLKKLTPYLHDAFSPQGVMVLPVSVA